MKIPTDIEKYIESFPKNIQILLKKLRETIIKAAPEGEELISYKMPAYKMQNVLVWYAAYKNHIGLYPKSSPILFFKNELSVYKTSKGAIQFPIDKPLPIKLITKIVQFRHEEEITKIKKL
jgi:uncharacterized protein YdhG (YjbR/CyaY superfamily)